METKTLHTIAWKEGKIFVAKLLELELASQGETKEKAIKNLKEALDLYLENENINNLPFSPAENVTTQLISLN